MKTGEDISSNRISFLNTYIDSVTATEAKHCVEQLLHKEGNHYVVTPNTDIMIKLQEDLELKKICEEADLILTDGQMLVKLSRWLGNPIKERVCMTDFVWDICDLATERGYKLFLLGGKEEVLKRAVKNITLAYPNIRIAGSISPPIGFEKNDGQLQQINEQIRQSGADILLVFLGCPKQETFIYHNKDKYQIPVSITMGGCVDFIAGSVKRAPKWMQESGLEWFYRFLQEPRRLFKRYFIDDVKIFRIAARYKMP